jgi:hypothetical protein
VAVGDPRLAPLTAGLHNVDSWALLAVLVTAVAAGLGRDEGPAIP